MWPLGSSGMVPDCAISAPVELYNSYWYETAGCVLSTRSWISRPGLAVETRAPSAGATCCGTASDETAMLTETGKLTNESATGGASVTVKVAVYGSELDASCGMTQVNSPLDSVVERFQVVTTLPFASVR